jgi:peptidoglycan-associated lipoprotein
LIIKISRIKDLDLRYLTTKMLNNPHKLARIHNTDTNTPVALNGKKDFDQQTGDVMKSRIRKPLLLIALVGSLILLSSGCSKKSVIPPESTAGNSGSTGGTLSYPAAEDGAYSENNMPAEGTLDDTSVSNSMAFDQQSDEYKKAHGRTSPGLSPIYFDFDSASVRPDMVEPMLDNAQYLKQVPNSYVIVEGNTDERGTNEYNLALAERRAQNTRQYLVDLGVSANRIRTVSYGEEKPLFDETSEEAYSYNRRADFVIE